MPHFRRAGHFRSESDFTEGVVWWEIVSEKSFEFN